MPSYPALKALHVLAAIVLVGAMLTVAVARASGVDEAMRARLAACNRWVATPALLVVVALGVAMALAAGWFAAGWLQAKLVLVLALAALHGWQSRRTRTDADQEWWPIAAVIVLATIIATLAAVKPV